MRARLIRSQIYLPVIRFGVVDRDWKFVIFITLMCYCVPFMLDIKVMKFPLEIWSTLIGLVASIAFFNFVRIGRPPFWLQHQIAARMKSARHRQTLPTDQKRTPWLIRN